MRDINLHSNYGGNDQDAQYADTKAVLHALRSHEGAYRVYLFTHEVARLAGLTESEAHEALRELQDLDLVRRKSATLQPGKAMWRAATDEEIDERDPDT